jgi:death-on-curing protein
MEIPLDEDWLKALYDILIVVYSDTDRPITSGFPIVTDYDEGLLSVCVERGKTTISGKEVYPHILQKAAVLMHAIINFHPFVDGNKRVALLAANFYLHWNGYRLRIPKDADDFTIDVAKGNLGLNDILFWLYRNSIRTPITVVMHWLCVSEMPRYGKAPILKRLTDAQRVVLFPLEAIRFFRMKIIEERDRLSLKLHGNGKCTQ